MASIPGTQRIRLANSGCHEMIDTFGTNATPGLRNVQCERIAVPGGTTPVQSAILVPTGVRVAILGVGVTFQDDLTGAAAQSLDFEMTRAGSPLLGTSDDALGAFAPVLPEAWLLPGQGPILIPTLHQEGSPLITAEGDGLHALWQVVHTLPLGVDALVTVTLWPFLATDIGNCE